MFQAETIFLPKTVLLEAEWLLRRLYRRDPLPVTKALDGLISLPNVRCEDEAIVRRALDWKRDLMDFADALHAAGQAVCEV